MEENKKVILDFYLKMHQEQLTQIRHYETQRSTIVTTIIAISGALIGIITYDDNINKYDLHLAGFLILIGGFGISFLYKHSRRLDLQKNLVYDNLEYLYNFIQSFESIDTIKNDKYKEIDIISMRKWWIGLSAAIVLIGCAILLQILFF